MGLFIIPVPRMEEPDDVPTLIARIKATQAARDKAYQALKGVQVSRDRARQILRAAERRANETIERLVRYDTEIAKDTAALRSLETAYPWLWEKMLENKRYGPR